MESLKSLWTNLDFQWLSNEPILVGAAILAFFIIWLRRRGSSVNRSARRSRRGGDITKYRGVSYQPLPLMSQTEYNFWLLLMKSLPGYYVFPQVSTNALLNIQVDNRAIFWEILNKFNTTRVDFVVCDPQLVVLALIELDDQSHDQKRDKDRERDFITGRAGYRTVRFDCRNWPDSARIRQRLGLPSDMAEIWR